MSGPVIFEKWAGKKAHQLTRIDPAMTISSLPPDPGLQQAQGEIRRLNYEVVRLTNENTTLRMQLQQAQQLQQGAPNRHLHVDRPAREQVYSNSSEPGNAAQILALPGTA